MLMIVTLVGGAIATGLYLSAPARAVVGAAPPDLRAEPVTLSSASGATLRGWFIPGRTGGGAVVLLHGVGSNRLSMVRRARLLNAAGFSVLLFDLQAHGESTGDRITFGRREALDARAAVAYMRERLPGERVGAIGTSLGGAATLLGPGPLNVDALVLESVYSEIGRATANRIRVVLGQALGGVVAEPAARLMELLLAPILDVRPSDLRPIDHIVEVTAPVLVASGTRGTRTTIEEAAALFARAPQPKSFWAVEGAGHVNLEAFAPEEYRRRVLPFLVEHLQTK
jgi:pimeloyl-ACP methyl ester carboxylesterase